MRNQIAMIVCVLLVPCFASGASPVLAPEPAANPFASSFESEDACSEGIILDDGSFETAYGWVPSVIWGEYVQTFDFSTYGPTILETLCVCLTRTHDDDTIDFEVVVYVDGIDTPGHGAEYVFPASAADVPEWPDGRFYTVELGNAAQPVAGSVQHIGIRWNASVDTFFFVCADHSPSSDPVRGFFRDDRADGWGDVLDSSDWIFDDHAAMMIRVVMRSVPWIPTTTLVGTLAFATILLVLGAFALRRR